MSGEEERAEQEAREQRPSRHPILDRLENNDYDLNGQSLDYEPNLEFDDTDLKQELEEELEQLNANILRLNLAVHQQDSCAAGESSSASSTPNELPHRQRPASDQRDECPSQASTGDGSPAAASSSPQRREQPLSASPSDDNVFLKHLQWQLAQQQGAEQAGRTAYLESPHDLLEENFEEAFKSSLFEPEEALAPKRSRRDSKSAGARLQRSRQPKTKLALPFLNLIQQQQQRHNQPSGFYVGKQDLLSDKLEELRPEDEQDEQLLSLCDDDDDFSDIAQYNCVEVAGDDLFGRRIITIYACRLPSATRVHHLRLLKYIMFTLDQYVENDYCVVYFHYGLNSQNKPKLNFLYQAYRAFDRKYKKNLKALFLVHPTNFIRFVWQLFKPIIR